MTLGEVRRYARLCQKRLKLSEWDIVVRWMTKSEERAQPEWNGFSEWNEQYKKAKIVISRESECIKHTVVHEMLHLRIEGHKVQPNETSTPMEVLINAISDAFMELEAIAELPIPPEEVKKELPAAA